MLYQQISCSPVLSFNVWPMINVLVTEEGHLSDSVTQQCIFAEMEICNFGLKCLSLLSVNKNANLCFFFSSVSPPLLLLLLIAASVMPFQQVM